jgi:hypothetical protein
VLKVYKNKDEQANAVITEYVRCPGTQITEELIPTSENSVGGAQKVWGAMNKGLINLEAT